MGTLRIIIPFVSDKDEGEEPVIKRRARPNPNAELISIFQAKLEAQKSERTKELRLKEEELSLQRERLQLEKERFEADRREREARFLLESQERNVILNLLKDKLLNSK